MTASKPHVLIIEDNPANLLLTRVVLLQAGFRIDVAVSAEEGRARLREQLPDVLLTDIQLPGMDGLELARLVRADPATASLPIIALSAHAMKEDEEKALEAGCNGFIRKPIDTRRLAEQICAIVGRPPPAAGQTPFL